MRLSPGVLLFALACSTEGLEPQTGDDDASSGQGGTSVAGSSSKGGGAGGTSGTGGVGGTSAGAPSAGTTATAGSSGASGGKGGQAGAATTGGAPASGGGGETAGGDQAGGTSGGGKGGSAGATNAGTAGAGMAGGGNGGTGGAAGNSGTAGTNGGAGGAGLGAWTDGYVATMYGNIDSGDCVAYSGNFTDHTPIDTYTCVQGNGPRKVSLSAYAEGQANNASYYAALGDLSSLWTANGNASQCTCNGSTTATCGGPQCPSEISATGACGICIAVKCDPNSTFTDSMGYSHNSSCNTTTYVVVQNIDACPHNHTTNVSSSSGWCTERQAEHIDLSCSGLGDISNLGTEVGRMGWLPVSVQVVDCSVGLGKHSL